ncbi:cation-translocating P-type ATPase [Malikia spinosa]|uniref:Cation-transporting P-type ATPase n=1 Tax=Malikia spinosa TaxID=86180 RepID=A0A7C9MXX9_9BURK|nr:cation-transporting P-type ATPase [Malikia spinosa]MYZ52721.1 cation-transporting P-type ATPase [Malikia spinosa]
MTDDRHVAEQSIAEALRSLGSSELGLTSAQAGHRLQEYGPNRLAEIAQEARWRRLLREFTHFFAIILWIAAGLALFAETRSPGQGMWQLGIAILAVILVNGLFAYWQEHRAGRAIDALRELLPQQVKVMRDGQMLTLASAQLVPGDVILLEAGDNVPADCRLLTAQDLRVDASTLTGESLPQARSAAADPEHDLVLERRNLLLAGTALVSGEGRAVVFATGMQTEFGQIARLTQTASKSESHLQEEIRRLSRLVALLASGLGLVFFGVGLALELPFWASLMFAIGIIVANVPEGLMPTVTLSLAMATQRMARRHALIRHLPAVETLGATTVICTDKTGTITQNRMTVRQFYLDGRVQDAASASSGPGERQLLRNAALCHSLKVGQREGQAVWQGDPMELALAEFGRRALDCSDLKLLGMIAFDADRRRMSVTVELDGQRWLFCKGAPEVVLPLCDRLEHEGQVVPLAESDRLAFERAQQAMADRGLRVLAFACKRLDPDAPPAELPAETGLTLSGLIGLHDPPRPGVAEAIGRCQAAGIRVIMVTGDHPHTAVAIAREIGLVRSDHPRVILGESLRGMAAAQLQTLLESPELLFARVSAEQKALVVNALKHKGEIVAVTGDGVNDAPALKSAHIGIAMGLSGTDVAKSAADMILLDDHFASIVNAIEEGRAVFENLRKFLTYILTSNIPELVPYLVYVLLGVPLPLTIIQMLAVDLGTDLLPALALGAERPDAAVMQRPPRPAAERLLSWGVLARAYLWLGPMQAVISLFVFFLVLQQGRWQWGAALGAHEPLYLQATTACLAAIIAAQVVNVFVCRHPSAPAWSFSLRSNRLLWLGVGVEIALLLLIVYSPPGQWLFSTAGFDPALWWLIGALAVLVGLAEEGRKWLFRRWRPERRAGVSLD